MPIPPGKLTDLRELGAYVIAHGIGMLCSNTVHWWMASYLSGFLVIYFVPNVVMIVAVLLLFLPLRRGMAAGRPRGEALTSAREVEAYLIAHAVGLLFSFFSGIPVFRFFHSLGFRDGASLPVSIATNVVVLLIFLFLRRAMTPAASR